MDSHLTNSISYDNLNAETLTYLNKNTREEIVKAIGAKALASSVL